MSKRNICIIIVGGAVVGALSASIIVFPAQNVLLASAAGLVSMVVAAITGIELKKEA